MTPMPSKPPPDLDAPPSDPRCVACGAVHGSVGQQVNCMAAEIRRLRQALAQPAGSGVR